MQSSRGWPRPTGNSPPKYPYLMHATSLLDLNDSRKWGWASRVSSPTDSSSSSVTQVLTPTASQMDSLGSRASTRTPSATPPSMFDPNFTYKELRTNNPWRPSKRGNYSPPVSPRSSPNSRTPQSESRASTPVAPLSPQPVRPISLRQVSDETNQAGRYRNESSSRAIAALPNLAPDRGDDDDRLPEQVITPTLHLQLKYVPRILTKNGWQGHDARWAYQWAIRQPRTALLLWMCDDLQAWSQAQFWQLKDSQLPFAEKDLQGIAGNPQKVVKMQWRVALRQLPRDGSHIEFQLHEPVPLDVGRSLAESSKKAESLAQVCFLDSNDNQLYVRKRFEIGADRHQDKLAILAKIRSYNRLEHENIAKIIASYARGQVVAYVTPYATCNLQEYLAEVRDPGSVANVLLTWAQELCVALAYLHRKNIVHRSIRPQKILVDTSSGLICFAPFGISPPARTSAYASYLHHAYTDDPRYLYSSPETIAQREMTQASDVFSLGACLLDIIGVVKGYSVKSAASDRATLSSDLSFHANADRLQNWMRKLWSAKVPPPKDTDCHADTTALGQRANHFLKVIRLMLLPEPGRRKSMRKIVEFLNKEPDQSTGEQIGRGARVRSKSVDVAPSARTEFSMRRIKGNFAHASSRETSPPKDSYTPVFDFLPTSGADEAAMAANIPLPVLTTGRRNALVQADESTYPTESAIWDLSGLQAFYRDVQQHRDEEQTSRTGTTVISTSAFPDYANASSMNDYTSHTTLYSHDYYDGV